MDARREGQVEKSQGFLAIYSRSQVKKHRKISGETLIAWLVLIIALLFVFFPIYWLLMLAFRTRPDIFRFPVLLLPIKPWLGNINYVLFGSVTNEPVIRFLGASLILAISATLLATTIGVMCAYGIARYKIGGRNLSMFILAQRYTPAIAMIIPLFIIYKNLGMLDSYPGLILLYTASNIPLAVWLMLGFIRSLPIEIEEAAMVEGASYFQTFLQVVLPLITPGLAVTAIFTFIACWNEYIFAYQLAGQTISTITVYIPRLRGANFENYGEISVASLLSLIPAMGFAWVLQRNLVSGLTVGGTSEL